VVIDPDALPPGKESPQYPLVSRLGGPQSQYVHSGEEKNLIPAPAGNRTPAVQLVV